MSIVDNPRSHGVVVDTQAPDAEGRKLYALAIEKRNASGVWEPDEITHIHAFSEANARVTYWTTVPPALLRRRRIVSCGLSIGGHAEDANADSVVI